MRPIHRAHTDKERYVLLLTPERLLDRVSEVTVVPISSGPVLFPTQLAVDEGDGVDHDSVAKCESITTIRRDYLGDAVGSILEEREYELRDMVILAFGLPPIPD